MKVSKVRQLSAKGVYAFILALSFLLYGNTISNNYSFDDEMVVGEASQATAERISKGIAGIPELFMSHYADYGGQKFSYRPMVLTTFALEHQFFGFDPHVSHLINLLLYALTGMVLFALLTLWFPGSGQLYRLLIVGIFLLHPAHTEVVNNLKSRDELLCFVFALGMLIQYFHYGLTGHWRHLILGLLWFTMALLSKATIFAFVGVVPFMLYFFQETNWKRIGWSLFSLLSFTALIVSAKGALLGVKSGGRTFAFYENPLFFQEGFWVKFTAAAHTMFFYFKLLVFPFQFSFYYGHNQVEISGWDAFAPWLGLLLVLTLGGYALYTLKRKHVLAFCIVYYFGIMFSFSNLVFPVVGIVGERFLYMASFGFCIAVVHLAFQVLNIPTEEGVKNLGRVFKRFPTFKWSLLLLFVLGTIRVVSRNNDWKDRITLFEADINHTSRSSKAHVVLANMLCGRVAESKTPIPSAEREAILQRAIHHYEQAIAISPQFIMAYNSLAFTYITFYKEGEKAKYWFMEALKEDSVNSKTLFNLASLEHAQKQYSEAQLHYEKALDIDVTNFDIYNRLSSLYLTQGDTLRSIQLNKKGLSVFPENKQLIFNIATIYHLQADTLNAISYFQQAMAIDPSDMRLAAFYNNMLNALSSEKHGQLKSR